MAIIQYYTIILAPAISVFLYLSQCGLICVKSESKIIKKKKKYIHLVSVQKSIHKEIKSNNSRAKYAQP